MYGGAAAPTGWLLCDGAAISRATYAALFAVVGTVFGAGDGSTTFNILDLRGRLALGKDNMGGSSANRVTATEADNLGQGSGAENHTLVVGEMPAHTHRERHNAGDAFEFFASGGSNYDVQATAATTNTVPRTTGSFGGGGAHNNMPPYLTLNFIIAYE
jgi:microcystin-dependent protein